MPNEIPAATRPRRVLIVVENLPVPFDRRVWQQARTLRAAGYEVSVICPATAEYPQRREVIDGIEIHRHPLPVEADGALGYALEYGAALLWQLRLSLRVLFGRGFDAMQACNPPDTIFLVGGLYKFLLGKRFVFDHHDLNPELYEAKFGRRDAFWRLMVALERLTFATADISIATNGSYRKVAIERGRMRPERVFVVRSGPDLRRLRPVPPNPELRNGRRHLVGYVGVMGKQEGLSDFLGAVARLVQGGRTDVQFGFVGGGTELPALRRLAGELGIADHVTFTGRVPDDRLAEVLCTADVCVNPDAHNELNDKSTMNKIMEYMAFGKPIVQFDVTEGRFSAGESSLYARPGDYDDMVARIVELLDDPERRASMGAFGRARVERELSWASEAPRLLEAYASLWPGAAPAPAEVRP